MYDVHSPAVPPVDALRSKIKQFVDTGVLAGHPDRLWVNPDCGLKTRDWVEVHAHLKSRVAHRGPGAQIYGGMRSGVATMPGCPLSSRATHASCAVDQV